MTTSHELFHEAVGLGRELRAAIPEVYSGYIQMSAAALGEGGVLPARIREVIALAIAVTRECDGCVAAHARGAARQGATAQEVAEALGVAIAMNGGPGTVWAPRAYQGPLHRPSHQPGGRCSLKTSLTARIVPRHTHSRRSGPCLARPAWAGG